MSSELSLSWDDHPKTLLGVFEKLLETSTLVDCTIAAEGQCLKAHKIILSACSPYFQLLFSQENEKNPIVVLKDIKFQELKAMIDFMYRGKVKVPEERLGDFVDAAESLQIKGLGSGNSQKTRSHDTGNGDPDIQERCSQASHLPRKRQRRNDFQDGLRRPVHVVNFDSKISEEQSNDICVEPPNLCEGKTRLSVTSAINSPTSLPSDVSSEMQNFDLTKSVSFEELPLPPCEEAHPNPDSVLVESELEAVCEVDIEEPDFYIEPKVLLLEETEGETNSEIATNQFPGVGSAAPVRPMQLLTAAGEVRAPLRSHSASGEPSSSDRQRRHQCPECGRFFATPPAFARHHRVHTGERPYSCEECGNSFSQTCNLGTHMRLHSGERRYNCGECGKAFGQKTQLENHSTSFETRNIFVRREKLDMQFFVTIYESFSLFMSTFL